MIKNIAAYRFLHLTDLLTWQSLFQSNPLTQALKGTIVLSAEGINLMLAGEEEAIDAWTTWLDTLPEFAGLSFKISFSDHIPFKRLFVKIKKALVPGDVNPLTHPAPSLSAQHLKQWYQTQKDFIIIDTRNSYELTEGHFKGALDLGLQEFNEFGEKIAALPEAIKSKPVVLYCTGGIRCEKAAPIAQKAGFKEVYQLEGGILQYFETCGDAFYEGTCFVFDERRKVPPPSTSSS